VIIRYCPLTCKCGLHIIIFIHTLHGSSVVSPHTFLRSSVNSMCDGDDGGGRPTPLQMMAYPLHIKVRWVAGCFIHVYSVCSNVRKSSDLRF
jgi:hypothetical protein